MIELLAEFGLLLKSVNDFLYTYMLIFMLMGTSVFYTFRTGFVQFRMLREAVRVILEKPVEKGGISSFQALMVSTACRLGTGNIVGVSTAICLGGYGAVFWMWAMAFFGGASAFVECTLSQIYKKRGTQSSYGGTSYYIEEILGSRALGVIFSSALILTYAGGNNLVTAFNIQSAFQIYASYDPVTTPWIIGAILAVLTAWTLFGGGKRLINTTTVLVPVMGACYLSVTFILTILHYDMLPMVFYKIINDAFDFEAIFGGFTGSCVMYGVRRALFSNEAGIGATPHAAASADVSHPVKQGLVMMMAVFIDTLLVCSATAFMCLSSGVAPAQEMAGAPYVQEALNLTLGKGSEYFITTSMFLFGFTTLLGDLFYTKSCLQYILGKEPGRKFSIAYRIFACLVIFIGAGVNMTTAWNMADFTMGCMVMINVPVVVVMGMPAIEAMKDYQKQRKAGKDPVFKASSIGITKKLDYWQDEPEK